MKNPCGKTRPKERPYEVWQAGDWTWNVLKKYQLPHREDEHSRWFCVVVTPYTTENGDMGDVYARDIKSVARLVRTDYDPVE